MVDTHFVSVTFALQYAREVDSVAEINWFFTGGSLRSCSMARTFGKSIIYLFFLLFKET